MTKSHIKSDWFELCLTFKWIFYVYGGKKTDSRVDYNTKQKYHSYQQKEKEKHYTV